MAKIATGDHAALTSIYDRYSPLVLALARRMLRDVAAAEDLVEEVFIELWRRGERYDPSRGAVATYITTLTRSRAIDRLRSERRTPAAPLGDGIEPTGPHLPPELNLVEDERRRLITGALTELSGDQRQAIELAYYEGLSHNDVAQRLNKPLGTVKTWIRQGLIRLREYLRTDDGEAP